jgi:dTDP-4-amino-4,6-dideoxygalactose transaminase
MSLFRPIHHIFAPLADGAFCRKSAALLFQPWRWKHGPQQEQFRAALRKHCDADVFLFSTGREALLAVLQALGIGTGDEVIVQAFTCVVVPNAVAATGATSVFVDIEKSTLSLDPAAVRAAITPKTKAVICQHTFGIPAPLEELRAICNEHHVPLIEDCAHVIPDERGPSGIGTTGDFTLLSFGRDKAISGVTGGAIVSHRIDVSNKLQILTRHMTDLRYFTIRKLLVYPLLYGIARPFYGLGLGKAFLKLCSILGLLMPIVTKDEKTGTQAKTFHHLPNACAALALSQLTKLQQINDHRRMLTRFYIEQCGEHGWPVLHGIRDDLPLQKFPMFLPGAERIRQQLKKQNIHLHDGWTGCVICPNSVDPSSLGYQDGDDPRAEEVCDQLFSLPTHPLTTMKDAQYLVDELQHLTGGNRAPGG